MPEGSGIPLTGAAPGEFHYRLTGRSRGLNPGSHRGNALGGGVEFRGYQGLLDQPDPRRFDVRASIHDPFGGPRFRAYRQATSIPVTVVADLSASMHFADKLQMLAQFVSAAGFSAYRSGDPFGFVGCDDSPRLDYLLPSSLGQGRLAATTLAGRLRDMHPEGRDANGLLDARNLMPQQPGLVFLCSDFYLPIEFLDRLLSGLAQHRLVPVVLRKSVERQTLPRFGLAEVVDPETGELRTLLLRPRLHAEIRRRFFEHGERLDNCFARWNTTALRIDDKFVPEAVTRYFYA